MDSGRLLKTTVGFVRISGSDATFRALPPTVFQPGTVSLFAVAARTPHLLSHRYSIRSDRRQSIRIAPVCQAVTRRLPIKLSAAAAMLMARFALRLCSVFHKSVGPNVHLFTQLLIIAGPRSRYVFKKLTEIKAISDGILFVAIKLRKFAVTDRIFQIVIRLIDHRVVVCRRQPLPIQADAGEVVFHGSFGITIVVDQDSENRGNNRVEQHTVFKFDADVLLVVARLMLRNQELRKLCPASA